MKKPEARKENQLLMMVTPKIPKIVLDQQEKKKNLSKRKRRKIGRRNVESPAIMNEEEQKELMHKVE